MKRTIVSTASRSHVQRRNERLSMRKIERINRNPAACWVDLVMWKFYPTHSLRSIIDGDVSSACCRQDAARDGVCYCGKFATAACAAEMGFTSIIVD